MTTQVAVRPEVSGVRRRQVDFAAVPTVVVAAVVAGPASCGFDSTWALVWGGDLLHGRPAQVPAGLVLPTAHPASLALAALIRAVATAAAAPQLWSWLTDGLLLAALAGVYALGLRLGGRGVAIASTIALGCSPALQAAVGMGTVDVLFAAAAVWSVWAASTRPALALACAAVAALARPEGWLLLLLVVLLGQGWSRQRRCGVALLAAVPALWLLCGAALFADPLAALHVTAGNAKALGDVTGLSPALLALVSGAGLGCAAVLAGFVGWVLSADRGDAQERMTVFAGAGMAALLLALGVAGMTTPSRYFTAEIALLLPAALSAARRALPMNAAALTAGVAALLVGQVVQPGQRAGYAAEQAHAVLALRIAAHTGGCSTVSMPASVLAGPVLLASPRPVAVTADGGTQCRLVPLDADALTGLGWGPMPPRLDRPGAYDGQRLVAGNADWSLDVVG